LGRNLPPYNIAAQRLGHRHKRAGGWLRLAARRPTVAPRQRWICGPRPLRPTGLVELHHPLVELLPGLFARLAWRALPATWSGPRRRPLPNRAPHFVRAALEHFFRVQRSLAGEQLVKENSQAVDVAARINIQPAQLGLLRADVSRGSNELLELCVNGLLGQLL